MTEMLNKEFSRKTFVKSGGALIVGFSLGGAALAGNAQGAVSPYASNGPLDLSQVDSYIVIHADNTATILTGGTEHGQGSATGWLMIAAEELDLEMSQVRFVQPDTNLTPLNISTNSSQGTKYIGAQVRGAAAYARQKLMQLAATSLGVPVASLAASKGVVSGGGRSVTYADLIAGKRFNVTMPIPSSIGGNVPANVAVSLTATMKQGVGPIKPASQYKLVGTRVPRIDVPDMVAGRAVYAPDIQVPGMLHGRLVLPRGQGAYTSGAKVVSVDESSIKHIGGVRVVRRGDFLGVVAPTEYAAIQAAAQLKVKWADPPSTLAGHANLWGKMRADDAAGKAPAREAMIADTTGPVGNVEAALKTAAKTVSQTYTYQYNIHAPIGPGVAVADVTPNGALVMCHSQVPTQLRGLVARLVGLPENVVRIKIYPGSSHYGASIARRDAPAAAAVMSQLAGKPVRLQLMRWDEHGWDNFGPAHLIDLRGGVDGKGNIVAYEYTTWASPYVSNVVTEELVGVPYPDNPGLSPVESSANGMQYNLPNWRVLAKTLPFYGNYFKTAHYRASHSTQTTFGTEIFIDELAHAAGIDPIAFRRQNVSKTFTERYLTVLDVLAEAANWQPKVAASRLSDAEVVTGRGISAGPRANPTYAFSGVIVDVDVNKKTGKIVVNHIYGAQDQGLAVNPMGVENQIVGQVVHSVSRALHEQAQFSNTRVTSTDWVSYPILRFKDAPKVTPIVIQRPEEKAAGAGDYTNAHVPAAIANAFFDATGVRIRQSPMTPAIVRAVLAAAGGK